MFFNVTMFPALAKKPSVTIPVILDKINNIYRPRFFSAFIAFDYEWHFFMKTNL